MEVRGSVSGHSLPNPGKRAMAMDLEGKVVLVTGAGSGIGKAAALRLARAGATIAALGRTADDLTVTADQVVASGGRAITVEADISKPDEMRAAVAQIEEKLKRLDVVFANAGINGVWAPIADLKPEEWTHTLTINLTGTFLTLKYALPLLKVRGGSVIITSSVNGTRIFSNAGASAYSVSKAGQVALAKMAARRAIKQSDNVVVISTANGLKFADFKIAYHQETIKDMAFYHANRVQALPADIQKVNDAIKAFASSVIK